MPSWKQFKREILSDPETAAAYEDRRPHYEEIQHRFAEAQERGEHISTTRGPLLLEKNDSYAIDPEADNTCPGTP